MTGKNVIEVINVILFCVALVLAGAVGREVYVVAAERERPAQPQPSYVVRRGEFTIIDKRTNPDKTINPSWMQPNMRYTCTEEK